MLSLVARLAVGTLATGCSTVSSLPRPSSRPSQLTLPSRFTLVREPLVIRSDFPMAPHHQLLDELLALRRDLHARLALAPSDRPIQVYLFDSAERFRAFMQHHYPDLPPRRAFFLRTDDRLAVYAHWSDRVAEDLRHETTHAYLHAVVPSLPLWLDEGLAEYYEVSPAERGVNRMHLAHLLARIGQGDWRPSLARMEHLGPATEMDQLDYAESWAWVHLMLDGPLAGTTFDGAGMPLLPSYLIELQNNRRTPPLSRRLAEAVPDPAADVRSHLLRLAETRVGRARNCSRAGGRLANSRPGTGCDSSESC